MVCLHLIRAVCVCIHLTYSRVGELVRCLCFCVTGTNDCITFKTIKFKANVVHAEINVYMRRVRTQM